MKIAFYLENSGISTIDCSNIEKGNPGIGGTQYAMLQLATLLSENAQKFEYILYCQTGQILPNKLKKIVVKSVADLVAHISQDNVDILVCNKIGANSITKQFLQDLSVSNVKLIVWGHCFIPAKTLSLYAKNHQIKRLVAVSEQQLFTWCDHKIYNKATYIYNICDFSNPQELIAFENRQNSVVYVGAINPIKGVHNITKVWPEVIKAVPDANLYIIGSGKLYAQNAKLGKFEVAEEYYERRCLKPLLNKGVIHPSVHFLGVLGKEKWEVLNRCKVGIVNTAEWETFGYTMVEMQLAGLYVTSLMSPGLLDTMYPDNGILYSSNKELAKHIIYLLNKKSHDATGGIKYVQKFSPNNVLQQWIQLFSDVYEEKPVVNKDVITVLPFIRYQKINKNLQKKAKWLPSLIYYRDIYVYVKKHSRLLCNPIELAVKIFKHLKS